MFTGIIQATRPIADVEAVEGLRTLTVDLGADLVEGLARGASVAVDGVCLTATDIDHDAGTAAFDVMSETLNKTTLGALQEGAMVHIERSAKFGDEIGGHLVSGHIHGTVDVIEITRPENNMEVRMRAPKEAIDYIFEKGYVSLAGASLTVVGVDRAERTFSIWLIPETLEITHFDALAVGDRINVEVDPQTVATVQTVERVLAERATQPTHVGARH